MAVLSFSPVETMVFYRNNPSISNICNCCRPPSSAAFMAFRFEPLPAVVRRRQAINFDH